MYNLLVSGMGGAWDNTSFELERGRVAREYTDDAIAERYKTLDAAAINELQSFPALFAYEQPLHAPARVGFLTRIRSRSGVVRFEFDFFGRLPNIPARELTYLTWELDIGRWEMNRTHWAVKPVDLFAVLLDAGLVTQEELGTVPRQFRHSPPAAVQGQMTIRPLVFSIPESVTEAGLVAVMMPFATDFAPVYGAIQAACADAGLRCLRADDIWHDSVVVQDIFRLLVRSEAVIVDFSGRNPNVMYETGIAHTLGRPVIPITQARDDIPFDLRHHRYLKYLPNAEGLAAMQVALADRLKTLLHSRSA